MCLRSTMCRGCRAAGQRPCGGERLALALASSRDTKERALNDWAASLASERKDEEQSEMTLVFLLEWLAQLGVVHVG